MDERAVLGHGFFAGAGRGEVRMFRGVDGSWTVAEEIEHNNGFGGWVSSGGLGDGVEIEGQVGHFGRCWVRVGDDDCDV